VSNVVPSVARRTGKIIIPWDVCLPPCLCWKGQRTKIVPLDRAEDESASSASFLGLLLFLRNDAAPTMTTMAADTRWVRDGEEKRTSSKIAHLRVPDYLVHTVGSYFSGAALRIADCTETLLCLSKIVCQTYLHQTSRTSVSSGRKHTGSSSPCMMQSNEYSAYDTYDYVGTTPNETVDDEAGLLLVPGGIMGSSRAMDINFEDPKIASMPKILLMGPRRGGKTSVQVRRR
jgi:hypothetical protein